jgi:hypothetical protein
VAAILAQVGGDAVGAGINGDVGGADRVGMMTATRVTYRCHVVDVHTEPLVLHVAFAAFRHRSISLPAAGGRQWCTRVVHASVSQKRAPPC